MNVYLIKTNREYAREHLIGAETANEALSSFLKHDWHVDEVELDVLSVESLGQITLIEDMR